MLQWLANLFRTPPRPRPPAGAEPLQAARAQALGHASPDEVAGMLRTSQLPEWVQEREPADRPPRRTRFAWSHGSLAYRMLTPKRLIGAVFNGWRRREWAGRGKPRFVVSNRPPAGSTSPPNHAGTPHWAAIAQRLLMAILERPARKAEAEGRAKGRPPRLRVSPDPRLNDYFAVYPYRSDGPKELPKLRPPRDS